MSEEGSSEELSPEDDVDAQSSIQGLPDEILQQLEEEGIDPENVDNLEFEAQMKARQGPIPPPQQLFLYDQIEPGLADRIVSEWEDQQEHRRAIERDMVNS